MTAGQEVPMADPAAKVSAVEVSAAEVPATEPVSKDPAAEVSVMEDLAA